MRARRDGVGDWRQCGTEEGVLQDGGDQTGFQC